MKKLEYLNMTYKEIEELDRDSTVFISSISPVETHGEHLPMGTDIFIAENLRERIIALLEESHPELTVVLMPTIPLGAEAIPVAGSISIRYQALFFALLDTGMTLKKLGFKYWLLTDNHGGPHHQIGIELAVRKLARKKFTLIAPFNESFRRMIALDPDLLEKTGLEKGSCGDSTDSHGGRNETSLMLASHPDKVRDKWKETGPSKESPMTIGPKILNGIADLFDTLGAKDAAVDFHFLAHGLAWVSDPDMDPYSGDPSMASVEAGDAMMDYRADVAVELLESALDGNPVRTNPVSWSARLLRDFM